MKNCNGTCETCDCAINTQIKKLKMTNVVIENIETQIDVTQKSAYYKVFGTETERNKDLNELGASLKDALALKFAVIETLQLSLEAEKVRISEKQRSLVKA